MVKLAVMSDLHLEFPEARQSFVVPKDAIDAADVIVLAGDIHVGVQGLYWAAETFPGKPVIKVSGNHTFYGSHISRVSIALHEATSETRQGKSGLQSEGLPPCRWRNRESSIRSGTHYRGVTLKQDNQSQ